MQFFIAITVRSNWPHKANIVLHNNVRMRLEYVVIKCISHDGQESILQYSPSARARFYMCVAENVRNELWQNGERSVQMNDILHHFGHSCVFCLFVCVRNFVSFSAHS